MMLRPIGLRAFAQCLAAPIVRAQSLRVQRPVPYSEDGDIADKIRRECKIDEQLGDFLQEYAQDVPISKWGFRAPTAQGAWALVGYTLGVRVDGGGLRSAIAASRYQIPCGPMRARVKPGIRS